MIDFKIFKNAIELFDDNDKRNIWIVLTVMIVAALSSAGMVASVFPFLSVLSNPDQIKNISILAWIYETGGFDSNFSFLIALGMCSVVVILISNLLQIFRTWFVARFTLMQIFKISHKLLAVYLRQPYEYFLDKHSGEMSKQILSESQEVVSQFFRPVGDIIASTLTVITIVGMLLFVNPIIALTALVAFGSIYGVTFFIIRRSTRFYGQERANSNNDRFRLVHECLGAIKVIKLIGRECDYIERYCVPAKKMAKAVVSVQVASQTPQYVVQAIGFGGIIILTLILLDPNASNPSDALEDVLPIIGLFAFAGQRILPELSKVYQGLTLINAGCAALNVIYNDIKGKEDGTMPIRSLNPLPFKSKIILNNVNYSYNSSETIVLKDVSLSIHAGEKIGIVGLTGAGKTTLIDILLGLLRPNAGKFIVDETEITDENLRSWQQTVGYVPQDIFLADATLAENIAFGVSPEKIDQGRVRYAAKIAQIDIFISKKLAQGYSTTVGERGVKLSGGQRQRIGIARAIYHGSDLIVFDEATSALDNLTEQDLMKAIDSLTGNKTIVMIAHRLSTVMACDRIAVMKNGRLVDVGSWENLMENSVAFREISQFMNNQKN